jgi:phosphonate transport system substrate-binding protein
VELVQRQTYGEINELLAKGEIDVAFICSGPYALGRDVYGFKLLATPEINGSHSYQAYLIVNKNSPIKDLKDLRGKTFAFTDPDSNTGTLVPVSWLHELGERPETFFSKTMYTYSHDKSIVAVAEGTVDGASVDSLIWEFYNRRDPELTSRTRIIRQSESYGIPPLVASKSVSTADKVRIRRVLFSMHKDERGKRILDRLMIERFIDPLDEWYDSIREMSRKPAADKGGGNKGEKP